MVAILEKDDRECKICKQLKERIFVGKYPNGRDKKFANGHGVLWNGRICPDCHRDVTKTRQMADRKAAKDVK